MRVPLEWLADYVRLTLPPSEIAYLLTMSGLNVEGIENPAERWNDVLVGEIVEIAPHPSSRNPLQIAKVRLDDRVVTIVTGAQNVCPSDRVPVVLVGGTLPFGPDGSPVVIQPRPMAGIVSEGMLASARELGISDEHEGIYILPAAAMAGAHLSDVLGGLTFDLETKSNRPDTLSIIGVAREVAALTGQVLSLPDSQIPAEDIVWVDRESIGIKIEVPDLCPRFTALRIEGIQVTDTPAWMKRRITAAGMRPIGLLVDISNYVMLEYGQPSHAFDARKLVGNKLIVRRARPGEELRTLDDMVRTLGPDDLVIADAEKAVGIAGLMGGAHSEISDDTTEVLLEVANFEPIGLRRTAQRLGLRSEASNRFEKGLSPETASLASGRYLQLLVEITGSDSKLRACLLSDVWPERPEERTVRMTMRDLHRLTGVPVSQETARQKLELLGFEVELEDVALRARVPYWRRVDVNQSADLVEDVIRLVGYDSLPSTLPRGTVPPPAPPKEQSLEEIVRRRLLSLGVSEVVTGSLTSRQSMTRLLSASPSSDIESLLIASKTMLAEKVDLDPLQLLNPPTQERDVLRLTLMPSLLDVVARNLKHTNERVAFFEVARTYFSRGENELPYERRTLGVALSGRRRLRSWQDSEPGAFTFYDLKGIVESVLDALHVRDWSVEPSPHPALHPGRCARVTIDDSHVALMGELHPRVASAFDIEEWPALVAELDLDQLFNLAGVEQHFSPLPRYPSAFRDLAVVVPENTPADVISRLIEEAGGQTVTSTRIFDVYVGEPLTPGKKSIAIELELQSSVATLTQDEISAVIDKIVRALKDRLGAVLRE